MGLLDDALGDVSNNLVDLFGKSLSYVEVTEGAYNTATLKKATVTATTNIKGVVGAFTAGEINGTIAATDVKVTVARLGAGLPAAGPKLKDRVVINGVAHEIVSINPTYSGDSVAIYELAVRK